MTFHFAGLLLCMVSAAAAQERHLYWGDLHNHNSIGQLRGSLEHTYDIAESHLDFFAFTAQSQWFDMVEIPGGRTEQFVRGFDAVKANWDKIKSMAERRYKPGRFVPFIGYEVHSNTGDFHILFPGSFAELVYLPNHKEWQTYARKHGAILVPTTPPTNRDGAGRTGATWTGRPRRWSRSFLSTATRSRTAPLPSTSATAWAGGTPTARCNGCGRPASGRLR